MIKKVNVAQTKKIKKKITNNNQDKFITTQTFNKLTAENVASRLKEEKLATKDDIAYFFKKVNFDNKLKKFK